MPKIVYTTQKGLVQQAGEGVQFEDLPYTTVQSKTANFTVTQPGVYTMDANAVITGTLPVASAFPGGFFTFRSVNAFANVLTGSEAQGSKQFVQGDVFAGSIYNGSKLTLQAVAGASVTMVSDGKNYIVMPGSGSIVFSGS